MIVPPFAPFPLTRQGDIKTGGRARGFAACLFAGCAAADLDSLSHPHGFECRPRSKVPLKHWKIVRCKRSEAVHIRTIQAQDWLGRGPKCMQKPRDGRNGMHPRACPKISPSFCSVRLILWDLNRSDADRDLLGHTYLGSWIWMIGLMWENLLQLGWLVETL